MPASLNCSAPPSGAQLIYGGSGVQGTLADVWVFNVDQGAWAHITTHGDAPAAREMHAGCMVDPHTMLVFGGRAADGRILCDAAVLDADSMTWAGVEPTPFSRCAHTSVLLGSGGERGGSLVSCVHPVASWWAACSLSHLQGLSALMAAAVCAEGASEGASSSGRSLVIYGGFSGEAVEGDVLKIDNKVGSGCAEARKAPAWRKAPAC